MGPRGDQGYDGKPGSQGLPGPQGPPGTLTSNWKQCVWKNINDEKDTGLLKVNSASYTSIVSSLTISFNHSSLMATLPFTSY